MDRTTPAHDPYQIAPDTFLLPNTVQSGPDAHLAVSSMVIRGEQPIVIDTGAPIHREHWFRQLGMLLDPEEVRWIFISHDDGDHMGGLRRLLDLAPNATLVSSSFTDERVALEDHRLPLERQRWVEAGDTLDLGDRRLRFVQPPIFDGPTTRGVLDERTGALWAVDSFAALLSEVDGYESTAVDPAVFDESFFMINSLVSPWHQWLDAEVYGRHLAGIRDLRPEVVASAHGPVLRGDAIIDALARVHAMAGAPRSQPEGQPLLDQMLAELLSPA